MDRRPATSLIRLAILGWIVLLVGCTGIPSLDELPPIDTVRPVQIFTGRGRGTAIPIEGGRLLTNDHLLVAPTDRDLPTDMIVLGKRTRYRVDTRGGGWSRWPDDWAVVTLLDETPELSPLPICLDYAPAPGDVIVVVGFPGPLGTPMIAQTAMVRRRLPWEPRMIVARLPIRYDYRGMSGGPAVIRRDDRWQVIGVFAGFARRSMLIVPIQNIRLDE